MAQTITLYKIFIASPTDLKEERILIEDVIDELNISTFNNSDVKLELIKWETYVTPDIGFYPQNVVNKDIGNDYDIFIGLLWSKFGSPTAKYGSGTVEEFYDAYLRHKENPSTIKIMFYFKQAAIQFDKIDTESINLIRKFRLELGEKNLLYWEYNTIEEFQKLLRIHITRKVQELRQSVVNIVPPVVPKPIIVEEEELGLLDYMEIGEENFSDVEEILLRMTDTMVWIGKRFNEKTEEVNSQAALNPQMGVKARRRLINSIIDDMYSFNKRLQSDILLFAETYKKGIDGFYNAIKISNELGLDDKDDINGAIGSMTLFINSISETSEQCALFRDQMLVFPRMTKEFNQVKRASADVLTELITEFDIAINLAEAIRLEFN